MAYCNLFAYVYTRYATYHAIRGITIGWSVLACGSICNDLFTLFFTVRLSEVGPFNLNQVIARGVGNSIYNTDDFRLTAFHTTALLLCQLVQIYSSLPAAPSLFLSANAALVSADSTIYPQQIQVITLLTSVCTAHRQQSVSL